MLDPWIKCTTNKHHNAQTTPRGSHSLTRQLREGEGLLGVCKVLKVVSDTDVCTLLSVWSRLLELTVKHGLVSWLRGKAQGSEPGQHGASTAQHSTARVGNDTRIDPA
jgi:hypothetical protein